MRIASYPLVILLTLLATLQLRAAPILEAKYFGSNPGNLRMYYYRPSGHEGKTLPVVMVLHGCTQSADDIARQSGWMKLADERGLVLVLPAQRTLNNPSDCFNWFRPEDFQGNRGEVASILQMRDYAVQHLGADSTEAYAYGVSSGAAMAVAVLVNDPGRFKAGAILAGGPFGSAEGFLDGMDAMKGKVDLSPAEWAIRVRNAQPKYDGPWPSLFIGHGTEDDVVNPKSSIELMEQWTAVHGTDTIPDVLDINYRGYHDITRREYHDSKGNTCVITYTIAHLGHALAIDPGSKPEQGGETGVFAKDRDFHSTWMIAEEWGL